MAGNDDLLSMGAAELRQEAARVLMQLHTLRQMHRELRARGEAVQGILLSGPEGKRMRPDEGIPTSYGVLKRHGVKKGRAWVVQDEVDKDAGELGDLAPTADKRIVVEHASELPTAIAAELVALSKEKPDDPDYEPPVKVTEKRKYPTVSKLREVFGKDTKYVGDPPTDWSVVISIDNGEGEEPTLLGLDGS